MDVKLMWSIKSEFYFYLIFFKTALIAKQICFLIFPVHSVKYSDVLQQTLAFKWC